MKKLKVKICGINTKETLLAAKKPILLVEKPLRQERQTQKECWLVWIFRVGLCQTPVTA